MSIIHFTEEWIEMSKNKNPLAGIDSILLFQAIDDDSPTGMRAAAQTEHTFSLENEMAEEPTKDGTVVLPSTQTSSFEMTCFVVKGDEAQELVEDAAFNKDMLQVWEVYIDEPVEEGTEKNKYKSIYAQSFVEGLEKENPAEGMVELSATLKCHLTPQRGELELSPEFVEDIKRSLQYDFQQFGEWAGNQDGDQGGVEG